MYYNTIIEKQLDKPEGTESPPLRRWAHPNPASLTGAEFSLLARRIL